MDVGSDMMKIFSPPYVHKINIVCKGLLYLNLVKFLTNFFKGINQATDEVEYRFTPQQAPENDDDDDAFVESMENGEDINPDAINVRQFSARKDLYKLTLTDDYET